MMLTAETAEKNRAKAAKWRQDNPDKTKVVQHNAYVKRRKYYQEQDLLYYRAIKQELFNILGNKCVRCGFSDPRALQIDHIEGGGNKEHRERKGPRNMYQFYRRNPDMAQQRLQILCANCN